jgi:hypothetical protein
MSNLVICIEKVTFSYRLLCYYLKIERLRQTLNHKCTTEHILILKVHFLREILAYSTFDHEMAYCFRSGRGLSHFNEVKAKAALYLQIFSLKS